MDHSLLEWVCNKDWIILNTEDYFLYAPHSIANLLLLFIWFANLISLLQRKQGASIYEGTAKGFWKEVYWISESILQEGSTPQSCAIGLPLEAYISPP